MSPSFESTAGSTVSDPSIATATTVIVATPKDAKACICGEEHPRHGDENGQPGDEDGAPGGRRRRLERGLFAATRRALFAFPLQIEHRVVDTDGEPDQEDDRRTPTSDIGSTWLISATSPSVARTAVSPSSSGMPAATSAPKATSRMISVSGTE